MEWPSPPATSEPIATKVTRCGPLGLPVVEPRGITTAELRGALGRHLSDPVIRELAARLGRPLEDRAYGLLNFHDQGVTLVIDNEQYVEAVDLHGRTHQVRSYPKALPSGLRFADRSDDVERRLGEPLFCSRGGRCAYTGGGIEVVYGPDACVSTVTMRPAAEPGTALIRAVRTRFEQRGGAHGILVDVIYTLNVEAPARLSASLVDANGVSPEVIADHDERQRAGRLTFSTTHERGVTMASISRFVPYYTLLLSEGAHELTPQIVVEKRAADGDWSPVPLHFLHGAPPAITLEAPRCRWNRFGVQRVAVAERDYDGSIGSAQGGLTRPELRWRIALEERTIFTSSERSDTFAARWSERTPWFRACQGDGIAIDVEDVDAAFHEEIGGRTIEMTELHRITSAREVLSFGAVKELALSPLEQRDTLAASIGLRP